MAFDVEGARKAGYSDAEIASHLATEAKFDLEGAKRAGYTDGEVIAHFASDAKPRLSAEEAKNVNLPGASAIPLSDNTFANPAVPAPLKTEASLGQKALGVGEAALATGTGIVGGTAGMLVGLPTGITQAVKAGTFGTPEGANTVENAMSSGAQALTYAPRTPAGQEYTEDVGAVAQQLLPVAPMAGEMAAMGSGVGAAASKTRTLATDAMKASADQVSSVTGKVRAALGKAPDEAPPAGSVGAMKTGDAELRRARAENMPVPFTGETGLTEGQASRSFADQRFERETAKDPGASGEKIRQRMSNQNETALKNFDAMADLTGAEATTLRETGAAVDSALVKQFAADKAKVNVLYKQAEKGGAMEAPVTLDTFVQHLSDSGPEALTAPVLNVAKDAAVKLGIAAPDADGVLTARPVTLAIVEQLRKTINRATNFEPTNVRQSSIMKGLIDESTEGLGGQLYKDARAERRRLAQNYEDRAVINKLLNNKKGTADRQVALEDVFQHTIMDGSLDDVRNVRRVLHRGDESGHQAWRELQGATVNYLRTEATKNVTRDVKGNEVVSPAALDRAVKKLDADGKLDFVFGKRGAEKIRDLNDIVKDINTAPPGAVNTSNTASVLAGLFDLATSATTGLPLPAATAVKMIRANIKDRQLAARVEKALGNNKPTPKF